MNPANAGIIRAGKALIVHALVMALLYGLALLLVSDFDSASEAVRNQYAPGDVVSLLLATRTKVIGWYALSLGMSWIASAVFLIFAEYRRAKVRGVTEGRASLPFWMMCFLVAEGATLVLWWRQISLGDVAGMVLDTAYLWLVTAGMAAPALAFWLATGLSVTITLKPSVPAADHILPDAWN